MANIRILDRGGAIIRINNERKVRYDKIEIGNAGAGGIIKEITLPSTTESFEVKVSVDEMVYDIGEDSYYIYIYAYDGAQSTIGLEDVYFSDIPNGGDSTWHYYYYKI